MYVFRKGSKCADLSSTPEQRLGSVAAFDFFSNLKQKEYQNKASVYHEIFTMGVINNVLNINKQLECSPLVLQLKWQRSWDIPEASPGLYRNAAVTGNTLSHPSTDLQPPCGEEIKREPKCSVLTNTVLQEGK